LGPETHWVQRYPTLTTRVRLSPLNGNVWVYHATAARKLAKPQSDLELAAVYALDH